MKTASKYIAGLLAGLKPVMHFDGVDLVERAGG
jgi:hypothetical protein